MCEPAKRQAILLSVCALGLVVQVPVGAAAWCARLHCASGSLAAHIGVGHAGMGLVVLFTGCAEVVFDAKVVSAWVLVVPADPEAPGRLDGVPDQAGGREEVSAC